MQHCLTNAGYQRDVDKFICCCCPDGNVNQLLPLVEEYQITAVKKKCEEFLLTKTGSMELLITGMLFVNYCKF